MQKYHHNTQAVKPDAILPRPNHTLKAIDGSALVAHLKTLKKTDFKRIRSENSFRKIPVSHYMKLCELDRRKYRAIVVSTYMSHVWDGWTGKKKSKRVPNMEVMLTRRMMSEHFCMSESTAGQALHDLVKHQIVTVTQKPVFSGKNGKNLGTKYRLPWMEKNTGKCADIYWGLLISKPFLMLSGTLQAALILLHTLHNRKRNRLTIRPPALASYGISRNQLPKYIEQLRQAGLLNYVENHDYEFSWLDQNGKPAFHLLKLKKMHLTHTDVAPNSYQVEANET